MQSSCTNGSPDGDGVAFAPTHLVVDLADVLGLPGGVLTVADDDFGRFDEGPLQVLIGGFAHVAEAGLPAAGVDGGDEAGVAGQLAWRGEAIDGADLAVDDDGQDVSHSGEHLQQLDRGGHCDSLPNALFELIYLELQPVEGFELLSNTTPSFRGKPGKGCF